MGREISQGDVDWTEGESHPINSCLNVQISPPGMYSNPLSTPDSPISLVTPISPVSKINYASTASSSTGGGAPKRY